MRNVTLLADGEVGTLEVTDYVPVDVVEAYAADARTRWQYVGVGEEHDPGPAGDDGETNELPHLAGRNAGEFARYGDASTPENALDEHLGQPGGARGLNIQGG
jgi:hypothetical protein